MMRFLTQKVVGQEVPDEVSLTFLITGCPLACRGCHSADSWDKDIGAVLDANYLHNTLKKYQNLLTCVLFMGGEWHEQQLNQLVAIVREHQLKTCLYTGLTLDEMEIQHPTLLAQLDFIKVGRFDMALGGLENPYTNQRFLNLQTGECLNHRFVKKQHFFA